MVTAKVAVVKKKYAFSGSHRVYYVTDQQAGCQHLIAISACFHFIEGPIYTIYTDHSIAGEVGEVSEVTDKG